MSTLELENIKHADASSNAIELASDGTLEVVGAVSSDIAFSSDINLSGDLNLHSGYTTVSSTSSGAMSVFSHNAAASTSVTNQVVAKNSGYHSHFIRMYYDQGISFHVSDSTRTAGDVLYDFATPANQVSASRLAMNISKDGRVTTPVQPHIMGSPQGSSGSGAANAFYTNYNRGTLSFSSNRVTVPVAGLYLITFNSIRDRQSGRTDIHYRINGATAASSLTAYNADDYGAMSLSNVHSLSANDYIEFYNDDWYNSGSTSYETWRTASVTLIG